MNKEVRMPAPPPNKGQSMTEMRTQRRGDIITELKAVVFTLKMRAKGLCALISMRSAS